MVAIIFSLTVPFSDWSKYEGTKKMDRQIKDRQINRWKDEWIDRKYLSLYLSVIGANMKVPSPDPQIAIPKKL